MGNFTRRDVLKGGVVSAAGLAAASLLGSCAPKDAKAASDPSNGIADENVAWHGLYDVVVIGGGLAGNASAIVAAEEGAKVLLLEKAPVGLDGGNSRFCHQVATCVNEEDVGTAVEYYKHLRGKYLYPTDAVIEAYTKESSETEQWIADMGGNPQLWQPKIVPEFPEFPNGDSFRKVSPDGVTGTGKLFKLLKNQVTARSEAIDVWYGSPATELIQDPATKAIIGVIAQVNNQPANIRAKNGVIICSGGYENNLQMMNDYAALDEAYPIAAKFNDGDGIVMAARVGADMAHLHNVMCYMNTKFPKGDMAEWESASDWGKFENSMIYVGGDGTRFTDESWKARHGYFPFHGVFMRQPMPTPSWAVFDEKARQTMTFSKRYMRDGFEKPLADGMVLQADTLEELAGSIDIPAENLVATVALYNRFCNEGTDLQHGRKAETLIPFDAEGPFYATRLVRSVLNTQGGPRRNENGEIVDKDGVPIPHLYGAGECGEMYSTLYEGAGNVGGCLNWGRISGRNAAAAKTDIQPPDDLAVDPVEPTVAEEAYETAEHQAIGKADGHCGDIVVRVTKDGDKISNVEVMKSYETTNIGGEAVEQMPERFIDKTAAEIEGVDGVTGATVSSEAMRAAVADALAAK